MPGGRKDAELLLERLQAEGERIWARIRRVRARHAGEGPERAALQELRDLLKETAQTLAQQLSVVSSQHAGVFATLWAATLDFQEAQQVGGAALAWPGPAPGFTRAPRCRNGTRAG